MAKQNHTDDQALSLDPAPEAQALSLDPAPEAQAPEPETAQIPDEITPATGGASITLRGATINNAGHYIDAGQTLIIGEALTQIHPARVADLLASGAAFENHQAEG